MNKGLSLFAALAAFGGGVAVSNNTGTISDKVDTAEVLILESVTQALHDGGCSLRANWRHEPASGLAVTRRVSEYGMPAAYCAAVSTRAGGAYLEVHNQFLHDGGCGVIVQRVGGTVPEVGAAGTFCENQKRLAARAVAADLQKVAASEVQP